MSNTSDRWQDFPESDWHWPNFSPAELACRGTGKLLIDREAMRRLQLLRSDLNKPLIIRSGYRSPEHNARVGGAKNSQHMQGRAFDIDMTNHDPSAFARAATKAGFTGFGFYPRSNFIHIDTGPSRRWGDPFPERPNGYAPEGPVEREDIKDSRIFKGSAGAGLATAAAATVEEIAPQVEALASYSDTLRLVFLVLALVGIGIAIWARYDDFRRARR